VLVRKGPSNRRFCSLWRESDSRSKNGRFWNKALAVHSNDRLAEPHKQVLISTFRACEKGDEKAVNADAAPRGSKGFVLSVVWADKVSDCNQPSARKASGVTHPAGPRHARPRLAGLFDVAYLHESAPRSADHRFTRVAAFPSGHGVGQKDEPAPRSHGLASRLHRCRGNRRRPGPHLPIPRGGVREREQPPHRDGAAI
jgi:hypothetical protein